MREMFTEGNLASNLNKHEMHFKVINMKRIAEAVSYLH